MNSKTSLLALCSAAVIGVSGCGSWTGHTNSTEGSARTSASTEHMTQATHAVAPKPTKQQQQKYKDGTYSGVGETRIGAVQVAVTLHKDKITNVQITGYSTHYPISYINPVLPNELLTRQNIHKIDLVSGATLSTADFYYAVVSALQKAQNGTNSRGQTNA